MAPILYKSELELQEKVVGAVEALQAVSAKLYYGLAAALVLAVPVSLVLQTVFFSIFFKPSNLLIYLPPEPKPIELRDENFLSVDSDRIIGYARAFNPNSDLGLREMRYTFLLKNSEDRILHSYTSSGYLLPLQEKILFLPPFSVSDHSSIRVEVSVDPVRWSRFTNMRNLDLTFEQQSFVQEPGGPFYVSANLHNNSPYLLREVEIGVLLYDMDRKVVGANYTSVNLVQPDESRFIRVVWPNPIGASVVGVEFRSSVNQFDPNAISVGSGGGDEYDPRSQ